MVELKNVWNKVRAAEFRHQQVFVSKLMEMQVHQYPFQGEYSLQGE
jgi:hypothetical protein